MLALADRIYREDFGDLEREEDRPDYHVWKAFGEAFRDFDPDRGDQAVPAPERFTGFFRYLYRRRLARESRRLRPRRWRPHGRPPATEPDECAYTTWSRRLLDAALPRLDRRAATVLHARRDGRPLGEVATELGVAPKTLSNRYGERRLVDLVRSAVRAVVLGLSADARCRLVAHLRVECGLDEGQVSRLLCLPPDGLTDAFVAVEAGAVRVPDDDEAHALLEGGPGKKSGSLPAGHANSSLVEERARKKAYCSMDGVELPAGGRARGD